MLLALVLLSLSGSGCEVARSLLVPPSPTATATLTPTPTVTPTVTATPTPTFTPTPTVEPLRLSVNVHPTQVGQGHTLWIELLANRGIAATGVFEGRLVSFERAAGGAWAVIGVSVLTQPGAKGLQLSIADDLGANVMITVPVMVEATAFASEQIDIPADRMELMDPAVTEEEVQRLDQVFGVVTPQQLWQGTFVWPHVGRVTSAFGTFRLYNDGHDSYHGGMDIAGDIGAPVVAANRGTVALAGPLNVHGNAVIIDHGWGVFSAYYHLSEVLVEEGQQVAQGELVGRVGNTGLSTGAHLHWEMRVGGVQVDPVEWTTRSIPG
jgi:hypothetical protein